MTDRPKVWVLWHRYHDGSAAHIERVYLEEVRAKEDWNLLESGPTASGEWHIDAVYVFGPLVDHPVDSP